MLDMLGLWQYKVRFWEAMRMLSCVELHHPVALLHRRCSVGRIDSYS